MQSLRIKYSETSMKYGCRYQSQIAELRIPYCIGNIFKTAENERKKHRYKDKLFSRPLPDVRRTPHQ